MSKEQQKDFEKMDSDSVTMETDDEDSSLEEEEEEEEEEFEPKQEVWVQSGSGINKLEAFAYFLNIVISLTS